MWCNLYYNPNMPYKDKQKQAEHLLYVRRTRRIEFFSDKECAHCKSKEKLLLHHIDPSTKLGSCIWGWGEKRRREEIAKCIILCTRCHSRLHILERHNDATKPDKIKRKRPLEHGTLSAYRTYKCRCRQCVSAESKRVMSYRKTAVEMTARER